MGDLPVDGMLLRPVTDDDSQALIDLIGAAYAEYPGCVLDLSGVDADLLRPASTIAAADGEMVVVDAGEQEGVVACVGWAPAGPDRVELKRLYVAPSVRGRGLGTWLVRWVEERAREHGAEVVELWSDTRFLDAHRLYEHLGYEALTDTRDLDDPSQTTERRFRSRL